jgi:ABC-2 type transport system permease protein
VIAVFGHAVTRRRLSFLMWSIGMVLMVGLLAVAFPAFNDNSELDSTIAKLPPSVLRLLGLAPGAAFTSPAGYLESNLFANVLPVMLLVFAVGFAAWTIAGDEAAGTLELLLANPVSRWKVGIGRFAAVTVTLAGLSGVCAATLAALAVPAGLDDGLPIGHMMAATTSAGAMAFVFAAIAFAVGAGTGSRPAALAVASAIAVAGFVIEGLAEQVEPLRQVRRFSPWHWMFHADPIHHGLTLGSWLPAVVTAVVLAAAGTIAFVRRDLR